MAYTRQTPPQRLYKYQPFTARTLTALKSRTLWFGPPAGFNDPFDCDVPFQCSEVTIDDCKRFLSDTSRELPRRLRDSKHLVDASGTPTEAFRKTLEESGAKAFAERAASSYGARGVTCFSERPDVTLLWSHYGGAHRGVCLEFDTSSPLLSKLHKVHYTDTVPKVNPVSEFLGDTNWIIDLLLMKASCWSYEEEWRAIHEEAGKEYCYGVEALTGVYCGAQLSNADKDLVCHLLHGSPTHIYEMRRSPSSLKLEAYKVSYSPYEYHPPEAPAG